jgi:hypothetical protein
VSGLGTGPRTSLAARGAVSLAIFVGVALATCAAVLLWLGHGDVQQALAPVRGAAHTIAGP